jgi:hypothetical protein
MPKISKGGWQFVSQDPDWPSAKQLAKDNGQRTIPPTGGRLNSPPRCFFISPTECLLQVFRRFGDRIFLYFSRKNGCNSSQYGLLRFAHALAW